MKNKGMNKETFVRIYREQISRAKLQVEIYSWKVKDMHIFGWRNIHLYTHKENRVNENSRVEHVSA
jgi:hypothetical protein